MNRRVYPGKAAGTLSAPPSKSMAHRLLIGAALARGESRIRGLAPSRDVEATCRALEALGAGIRLSGEEAAVRGMDLARPAPGSDLFCGESGSTLRFLLPLALLRPEGAVLRGTERLFSRGLSVYEDLCRERGIAFETGADHVRVRGRLSPGVYSVRGDVSSQFITGLLFALPLLEGDSEIRLTTPLESGPYVDLTLSALDSFGVTVRRPSPDRFSIPGGQRYAPLSAAVEGDWSNAAFPLALNFAGGRVAVSGLDANSALGDRIAVEYFETLRAGAPALDVSDCPDLAPVLMAAAALSRGATLTGTRRLKIKESDRGEAMAAELAKTGIRVTVEEDRIRVWPGAVHAPAEPVDGHNDHRVVMAMTVVLTAVGGVIRGAEAVAKSWPDFFERLKEIGVKTVETDEG
ncbi:MAG: 3-phosphoshikimate 1-carboxyvinyltransferase [Clostridia bacterium]|nr:3-phosphoshikimate 1-carboxyvinyltransferase [Clostridia bacterium]